MIKPLLTEDGQNATSMAQYIFKPWTIPKVLAESRGPDNIFIPSDPFPWLFFYFIHLPVQLILSYKTSKPWDRINFVDIRLENAKYDY